MLKTTWVYAGVMFVLFDCTGPHDFTGGVSVLRAGDLLVLEKCKSYKGFQAFSLSG